MEEKAKAYYDALELGLEIRSGVPIDKVVKIYNGTGPESFPDWARELLDKISETIQPALCGHDLDYYYGKGTKADFHAANERLRRNGVKCAKAKFSWYRPKRYVVMRQADLYADICEEFGWDSYRKAIKDRIEDEELEREAAEREGK